ncbi:hypothetical protein ACLGIH_01605 [Streptomyces sp. HMX87]|uniref:hypothetical protein n=1 Tax=Streptomyces sp. HMX87 TaxID=3390849 RepID=UPI003A8A36AA
MDSATASIPCPRPRSDLNGDGRRRLEEGDFLIRYDAEPGKDLLLAKRVYQEFWERHEDSGGYEQKLTCDEIPAVKAVERSSDTGYQCQVWHEGGNRTTDFSVITDTYGYKFAPVRN